jgi:hypothetical protein
LWIVPCGTFWASDLEKKYSPVQLRAREYLEKIFYP